MSMIDGVKEMPKSENKKEDWSETVLCHAPSFHIVDLSMPSTENYCKTNIS
jgi:hypothetical protein